VSDFPSASLFENARFNALVVVPNALQGIFKRRSAAVRVATRADVDRWAVGLLSGMRRSHGGGPVWVRVVRDRALLLLDPDDIRRVLERSPSPFASDPPAKKSGMSQFQPDALTISRGELWENRRRFAEAVFDTLPQERGLRENFADIVEAEAEPLVAVSELGWDEWHRVWRRITRRIVFGDAAADDEELSESLGELMSKANSMPSEPAPELEEFERAIERYVEAAEPGSLASLAAEAPSDARTKVAGQFAHPFFATQDTLAINTLRALALIASHPRQRTKVLEELGGQSPNGQAAGSLAYLEACIQEAMRLWPTTTMLSREAIEDVVWNGATIPAGTQVLVVNTFEHRDRDTLEYADRFYPEAWTKGDAARDWRFNHFSHGPQGCPGAGLALFLGTTMLATLWRRAGFELLEPALDPGKPLPHMLDFFALSFRLSAKPERGD
jgi:cytochrome P450